MSNGPGTSPQLPALASQVWGCQLAPHAAPAFLQGQTKGRGLACALAKLPQLETRRCGGGFLTWGYVAGAARRLHRSRTLTGSFQASAGHLFLGGTFFPFLRAFERPMAIACSRLLTGPPRPPGPLSAVPRL
jgi:hypothetical protein